MIKIELDMYQTLALAVLVLMLGKFLRERVRLLDKFCIPAPVIGGVLFAIFTCICYVTGVAEFVFDDTLKEVCMVMFFTSVGFQANLKVLKSGGKAMIVFLGIVIVLIISQNFLAVGLASLMGVNPLVGLCTGSIPMVGGHGTAGAFGPVLEDFGIQGATTLCTAAATYGLIAGSMMGGPIGKMLIERHHLLDTIVPEDDSLLVEEEIKHERHSSMYPAASFQLIIAMGIGTVLSKLLSLTGMTFPILHWCHDRGSLHPQPGRVRRQVYGVYGRDQRHRRHLPVAVPGHGHDHPENLAAGRAGAAAGGAAGRTDPVHDLLRRRGGVQHYGPGLRRGGHRIRHLRLWHGRDPQRHGQYAGCVRQVFALSQSIPADPAGGQSVCGLPQQPGHYGVYQFYLMLSWSVGAAVCTGKGELQCR